MPLVPLLELRCWGEITQGLTWSGIFQSSLTQQGQSTCKAPKAVQGLQDTERYHLLPCSQDVLPTFHTVLHGEKRRRRRTIWVSFVCFFDLSACEAKGQVKESTAFDEIQISRKRTRQKSIVIGCRTGGLLTHSCKHSLNASSFPTHPFVSFSFLLRITQMSNLENLILT